MSKKSSKSTFTKVKDMFVTPSFKSFADEDIEDVIPILKTIKKHCLQLDYFLTQSDDAWQPVNDSIEQMARYINEIRIDDDNKPSDDPERLLSAHNDDRDALVLVTIKSSYDCARNFSTFLKAQREEMEQRAIVLKNLRDYMGSLNLALEDHSKLITQGQEKTALEAHVDKLSSTKSASGKKKLARSQNKMTDKEERFNDLKRGILARADMARSKFPEMVDSVQMELFHTHLRTLDGLDRALTPIKDSVKIHLAKTLREEEERIRKGWMSSAPMFEYPPDLMRTPQPTQERLQEETMASPVTPSAPAAVIMQEQQEGMKPKKKVSIEEAKPTESQPETL